MQWCHNANVMMSYMQCECDENMMMSCIHHAHVKTPMMSCHLIPTWHKWNANANDIMMIWFELYANTSDIMLGMHDMHTCAWHMCSK